jgi:hypothetical protein
MPAVENTRQFPAVLYQSHHAAIKTATVFMTSNYSPRQTRYKAAQ